MPSHANPDFHIYLDIPQAVFKARVNMSSVTYPVTELIFDTVTLGAYTDVQPDMTLLLGSSEGGDQYGRVRVQNPTTDSTIPVGRISRGVEDGELDVVDNAHITILREFRVWARLPWQSPDGVDYKDSTIGVGDNMQHLWPVVNMGGHFADYIDGDGVVTVAFDGSASYTMADGATIVTWAWDIGDGVLIAGALDEDNVTIEFEAGDHIVSLTITDSNGKINTGRRFVLAVDPANDVTLRTADVQFRLTQAGQTARVTVPEDIARTTYPDGALVMIWEGAPATPSDRSHMRFSGWHQSDDANIRTGKTGNVRETVLECVDIAGRLDTLPGFPQALERSDEVAWYYMPDLTINTALWYLAHWHSTALGLADFFLPPDGDDYPAMRLDSTGATLYDQLNSRAVSMCPDHLLTCNAQGQLSFLADWMMVDTGDRPAAASILTEDDYGDIQWPYQRPPRVHVLRSSAVVTSTDWIMLGGEETLPLAFSVAPGTAFSQGTSEAEEADGLTQSQEQLNIVTGHRYARLNARFGPVRVKLLDPDTFWELQPALMQRIQLNLAAAYAAQRGLPFTQVNCMVKELSITPRVGREGAALECLATLELETSGAPAVTHVPDTTGDPDDYEVPAPPPPTTPPGGGLAEGVQQVAGIGLDGNVYTTEDFQTASGSGGPTWASQSTGITEEIYTWVVDPFSPGYIDGAGTIDGWVATEDAIYRLNDLFGTLTVDEVFTFPTSAVAASFHWRTIQASFGAYFAAGANPWLACVSYYGDTVGHVGTWATYSTDGGVTWATEVQISAYYSTDTPTRFSPIGVYASPKTPGLVYTTAHLADETTSGFVSTNWGATWAASDFVAPGIGRAGTVHVPWPDNAAEGIALYGYQAPSVGTSEPLMPYWGHIADGVFQSSEASPTVHLRLECESVNGAGLDDAGTHRLLVAPPANAVRVVVEGRWEETRTQSPDSGGHAYTGTIANGVTTIANVTTTADTLSKTTGAPDNGSISQDFVLEWTRNGGETDWENGRDELIASPPSSADGYCRVTMTASVSTSGSADATEVMEVWMTITEIELEDSTIYAPATGNRGFRLKKIESGVVTDISPADGAVLMGTNRGAFGVRTFDSNRQYVLASVMGNDTTADADDDTHAVYISDDYGATWTEVVAPIADSGAPTNRPAFEAAFGGDSEDILFIWGPPDYISYSSDFGVTVDDRSGNLSGSLGFVGIAGGIN